ncbi:MAG TPA: hypothetical protein PK694_08575, partial [Rhodospirillales bacterium]|nr:hypothetical protein [Rhodospirillales bacterium]
AGGDDKAAVEREPESEGFAWVGQGEPSNFGSDYNYCNRSTEMLGRSQGVTRSVGATNTSASSPEAYGIRRMGAGQGNYADKRQFWVCMESRGWQLVGGR